MALVSSRCAALPNTRLSHWAKVSGQLRVVYLAFLRTARSCASAVGQDPLRAGI
jgi:hypothetical protein